MHAVVSYSDNENKQHVFNNGVSSAKQHPRIQAAQQVFCNGMRRNYTKKHVHSACARQKHTDMQEHTNKTLQQLSISYK